MKPAYIPTLFTPSQAEKISGLTLDNQRDLRRRGFMKKHKGHGRYDCLQVAEMMIFHLMSQRLIAPKLTVKIADICAIGVVASALQWCDSVEGPLPKIPETLAKDGEWSWARDIIKRKFFMSRGIRAEPARFLIFWADGNHVWETSLDRAFDNTFSDDPKVTGPVIVLDLDALGGVFLDKAGVPLIDLSSHEGE